MTLQETLLADLFRTKPIKFGLSVLLATEVEKKESVEILGKEPRLAFCVILVLSFCGLYLYIATIKSFKSKREKGEKQGLFNAYDN